MKLNLKAFMLTAGIFWALAMLLTGIGNLLLSGFGSMFLQVIASVYPGYHASGSFGDLIIGTLYALVDGAFGGLIFAYLYNLLLGKESTA